MRIPLLVITMCFVVGCATQSTRTAYSKPVTPQCQQAKSEYQMCYGNCLMVTPGGFLYAAGQCGRQCQRYSSMMGYMCH